MAKKAGRTQREGAKSVGVRGMRATTASAAIDERRHTVVYIHGIGNKPPPAVLKKQWDVALFGVDMGARTRLAYWADIRYPQPLAAGGPGSRAIGAAAGGAMDLASRSELSDAELVQLLADSVAPAGRGGGKAVASKRGRAGRADEGGSAEHAWAASMARQMLASSYDWSEFEEPRSGPGSAAEGARRTRSVAAQGVHKRLLPLPGFARRWVAQQLTDAFIHDTHAYLFDADQRRRMRERLAQLLTPEGGPYVVVAHSQGTIIAYDVLAALGAQSGVEVSLLITVGSPLGVQEVQDNITRPLVVPAVVKAWRNFADLLDPVALDKRIANDFKHGPTGVRIVDEIVVNRDTLRLSGFNPHSGTGYLEVSDVRGAARDVLGSGFAAPLNKFVIAKDVAAEMADSLVRQPVLIELKAADAEFASDPREAAGATAGGGTAAGGGMARDGGAARRGNGLPIAGVTLQATGEAISRAIAEVVTDKEDLAAAQVDVLKRYVAARLTAVEIDALASRHAELCIATIWKNARKRKLIAVSAHTLQAWTARQGYKAAGKGIAWAVLDTGVADGHPHFRQHGNVKARWDCTKRGAPVRGTSAGKDKDAGLDKDGHGTHVAGIIAGAAAAVSTKNQDFNGMAPECSLHAYKVLNDDGEGEDAWIIKALDHIAALNDAAPELVIHGVNLSLGGYFDPEVFGCGFSPICRELRRLWRQGVLVVLAAGNEGSLAVQTADGEVDLTLDLSIGDPANLDEAIAVGSVHRDHPHMYGISYFSSRGPTADGRAKPDCVAPGEKIISANALYTPGRADTHYIEMSGTSMACPHISGLLAAFLSVRKEFIGHPDQVKQLLLEHCTDLKRDRYHQGAGMPNLVKMLTGT